MSGDLPVGHPPLHSFLGVSLCWGGRAAGLLAVANRDGGYGEDERGALESLAPVATAHQPRAMWKHLHAPGP